MTNIMAQFPGGITIKMIEGNDFTFRVNWGFDITGYTFTGKIIPSNGLSEITMTVTPIDLALGLIDIKIASTDVIALPKSTNQGWYLDWVLPISGNKRTVLGGILVIYPKNVILKQIVEV